MIRIVLLNMYSLWAAFLQKISTIRSVGIWCRKKSKRGVTNIIYKEVLIEFYYKICYYSYV